MTKQSHWRELQLEAVTEVNDSKRLKALTKNQGVYLKAVETSTVTICTGPAGTGKTYMACGLAAQMLKDKRIERIVITRPLVACGKGIGFLPGTVDEKVSPFMRPLMDAFEDFIRPSELTKFIKDRVIEMWPLDTMRGASIKHACVICDEAQNAEFVQLHMLLTRFGEGARVVITGDASQTDLMHHGVNPLRQVVNRFRTDCHPSIRIVTLTRADIVRHPLIQWIDERLTTQPEPEVWTDITCPGCKQSLWYPTWATNDNGLLSCWSCQSDVEVYDDKGKADPIIATAEKDESVYETLRSKP